MSGKQLQADAVVEVSDEEPDEPVCPPVAKKVKRQWTKPSQMEMESMSEKLKDTMQVKDF